MGSLIIEAVGEGVDEGLQFVDAVGPVEAAIELAAPGALGALDGAVELGAFGRQDEEGEAFVGVGLLEGGLELRAAVDLNGFDGERGFGAELVEDGFGGLGRSFGRDAADGLFGDRIIGGEVVDRPVRPHVHKERVDLDDLAGLVGLRPLGRRA